MHFNDHKNRLKFCCSKDQKMKIKIIYVLEVFYFGRQNDLFIYRGIPS